MPKPKDGLSVKQRSVLCGVMLLKDKAEFVGFTALEACFDDVVMPSRETLEHALAELEAQDLVKLVRSGVIVIGIRLTPKGRAAALKIQPYQVLGRLNLKAALPDPD